MIFRLARPLLLGAALLAPLGASAHDTWFQPVGMPADTVLLRLGTGDRFPQQEFSLEPSHLARSGCLSARGHAAKLVPVRRLPTALLLRSNGPRPAVCWAEVVAFDIQIADDKVDVYLGEIDASLELRAAWQAMKARGVKWQERYRKHARIDLDPASSGLQAGLGLEIVPLDATGPGRTFRVLHQGRPLPGFPVELRGANEAQARWYRSDADGLLRIDTPGEGRWVLRGTHLRLSTKTRDSWESDFVTLAFEGTPSTQPPSSLTSNALSTSHTAASPAIAPEPPTNTSLR